MITTEDLGRIVDLIRPALNQMVQVGIDEARRKGLIPAVMPGIVTSVNRNDGTAFVLLDTGGDPIPVKSLIGMPATSARVMVLWEPPSQPFVVGYLGGSINPRRFGAQATLAAPQLIASATPTSIVWDTEQEDNDGYIVVPSTQFTVPNGLAGRYLISASVNWAAAVGAARAFTQISGPVDYYRQSIAGGGENIGSVCGWLDLADGDQFSISVFQTTGVGVNVNTALVKFWRLPQ